MAADLEETLGAEVTLVASSGGVYEVSLDGELLFSKKKLGRFPEEKEIEGLIASTRR